MKNWRAKGVSGGIGCQPTENGHETAKNQSAGQRWVDAGPAGRLLTEGRGLAQVDGVEVLVVRTRRGIFAVEKQCPHTGRHLTDAELATASDGRVFTGHQAIDLKLIDELGDERTALAWLGKEKNVDTKLPVRDYELQSRLGDLPFLHAAAVALLDAAGLNALARQLDALGAVDAVERFNLDGLLALWHPASAN